MTQTAPLQSDAAAQQARQQAVTDEVVASFATSTSDRYGEVMTSLVRHLHFKVTAPGHRTLIAHVFVAGDEYLHNCAVFGVKDSLIAEFTEHHGGTAPDGSAHDGRSTQVEFDLVRTVEIFRDLGIEDDVLAKGTEHALIGDTVICTSLAGDEIGLVRTLCTHPARAADYTMASPQSHVLIWSSVPQEVRVCWTRRSRLSPGAHAASGVPSPSGWALKGQA